MAITFKYVRIDCPKPLDPIKAPAIPLTLIGKEQIDVVAMLDSGADTTVISRDLAEILGISLKGEKEIVMGIGGKGEAILSSINMIIKNSHERYNLKIPVFVLMGGLDDDFPVLLGRAGFFDNFEITFKENQGKVVLRKVVPPIQ